MYKIKLLILLLISVFIFSCTSNKTRENPEKFSIAYIGGEIDGLLLRNILTSTLKNSNMLDQTSDYEIRSSIDHGTNLYITNIDNTSDRKKIETSLSVEIINEKNLCVVFSETYYVSQFYIFASSEKFLSNQKAIKKIKKDNTEALVKKFTNELINLKIECNEKNIQSRQINRLILFFELNKSKNR
tara:strand:+ start:771 stop:1328 length:558 start_codon:yes stop_codon:yes gene_type:complete